MSMKNKIFWTGILLLGVGLLFFKETIGIAGFIVGFSLMRLKDGE